MIGKGHVALIMVLLLAFLVLLTLAFPQFAPKEERRIGVYSTAFQEGGRIPDRYSREGGDVSPPISWEGVPEAVSYALVMYDPDAPGGTFYHWIIVNIPPNVTSLPENLPKAQKVEGLGVQCLNDYGDFGYGGPMPPAGETHRYVFAVYALDSYLDTGPECDRRILNLIHEHKIAYGELTGLYGG